MTDAHELARAEHMMDLGRYREASDLAGRCLAMDPESIEATLILGQSLTNLGRAVEAERLLRVGVAHDPTHASLHMALSDALNAQGRKWDAAQSAREAILMAPHEPHPHLKLANVLSRGSKYEVRQALRATAEALRLDPHDPDAHVMAGVCHVGLGSRRSARRSFSRALELNPADAYALNNLAVLGQRSLRAGRRVQLMRSALALEPSTPLFLENLHILLQQVLKRMCLFLSVTCIALIALAFTHTPPYLRWLTGTTLLLMTAIGAARAWHDLPRGLRVSAVSFYARLQTRGRALLCADVILCAVVLALTWIPNSAIQALVVKGMVLWLLVLAVIMVVRLASRLSNSGPFQ